MTDADATAGVAGVQCGIDYLGAASLGVDVFSWTNCATLEFPTANWPDAGTGNLITWSSTSACQTTEPGGSGTGVVAVAGYFYCAAYTPDFLRVTPRPVDLLAKVASCDSREDTLLTPTHLGFAAFSVGGLVPGYNPCGLGGDSGDDGGGDDGFSDGGGGGGTDSGGGPSSPDGLWSQNMDGTFALNDSILTVILSQAPMEFTPNPPVVPMTIPMPDGSYPEYRIFESPTLSSSIASLFPGVKTYAAQGIDDRTATVRFDRTPDGFHAMVLSAAASYLVQPVFPATTPLKYEVLINLDSPASAMNCTTPTDTMALEPVESLAPTTPSGNVLSTYRTVINATSTYTTFYGSVTAAQHAMITATNRVSTFYERDAAIRLVLTRVTAFPTGSDPFSGPINLLTRNQQVCDSLAAVHSFQYDLGHLYHTGSAGVNGGESGAEPGACLDNLKGAAYSQGEDLNSFLFLSVVGHEMGHQFGASHTYNRRNTLNVMCCGAGRGPEPGSGSTFMSDPSPCSASCLVITSQNDTYFHSNNYSQMVFHRDGPNACAMRTATSNNPPVVSGGPDYTIPAGTPFMLAATATDLDGDSLTYCWEQNEIPGSPGNLGPLTLFRSRRPTTSSVRSFPQMRDVLHPPASYTFETLPTAGETRDLNFRITVRDNQAGVGGVSVDDVTITAQGLPFQITYPNVSDTLSGGDTLHVNWAVGGSSGTPFVDIDLIDREGVYVTRLAARTENDGAQVVLLPSNGCDSCRVMVKGYQNIFFDVTNGDLWITQNVSSAGSVLPDSRRYPLRVHIAPNPVDAHTSLFFDAANFPRHEHLKVTIVDVSGRSVRGLYDSRLGEQWPTIEWDRRNDEGKRVSAGLYFVKATLGGRLTVSRKVVVIN